MTKNRRSHLFLLALALCLTPFLEAAAAAKFKGSFGGSFRNGATYPFTLVLSQSGSSLSGKAYITTGVGVGTETVRGSVRGKVATINFINSKGKIVTKGAKLTLNGNGIDSFWKNNTGVPVIGSLTPTAALTGTWTGTFQSTTSGPCLWTGGSLNSPALTLQLKQSGITVTGFITFDVSLTDSSEFSCPTYSGWSESVINGTVVGNILTFFDAIGSHWQLNATGITGQAGTLAGSIIGDGSHYLTGTTVLSRH